MKGRDIHRGGYKWASIYLITSHNGYTSNNGERIERIKIEQDYPAVKKHLDKFWGAISKRTDKGDTPYNLRNCAYMDDFDRQKVVWSETNDVVETKVAIVDEGYLLDKTTFFIPSIDDGVYRSLSSQVFTWYIRLISPLLGASGISLTKETVEKFPICTNDADYGLTEEEMKFISS